MVRMQLPVLWLVCLLLVVPSCTAKQREPKYDVRDRAARVLLEYNSLWATGPERRELLEPFSFYIEIGGQRAGTDMVESVEIDPIEIEPIIMEAGEDPLSDERVICPGKPKYGHITIRSVQGSSEANMLYDWWKSAAAGSEVRKDISVVSMTRDGNVARRWNIVDAEPVRWDPGEYSPSSTVACETIVCKMGRVELGFAQPPPDNTIVDETAQFFVTIEGGKEDSSWETCSGGGLQIETPAAPDCPSDEVGKPVTDVTELTLRGPLTDGRGALDQWMTAALSLDADDKEIADADARIAELEKQLSALKLQRRALRERRRKRSLQVRQASLGGGGNDDKTFTYVDCFPTRYVFPSFSASGTGNLYEEIAIKPIRLELA